jgi:type III secretion protein Q
MAASSTERGNDAALDSEPISLTFQLGELSVPAAELRSLDAGFVFPLRISLERPVSILANGGKFGVGELVEVDGALAVRLLEGDGHGS